MKCGIKKIDINVNIALYFFYGREKEGNFKIMSKAQNRYKIILVSIALFL